MKEERVVTSVSLSANLLEKIDTQADREKRTRSNMIECLLDAMIRKAQNEEQEKGN